VKVTCANPECVKTIHPLWAKLRLPGSGEKRQEQWFCSRKCSSNWLADQYIEDKRCGLKRTVRQVKLGMLLLKNNFINQEQLTLALEEKSRSTKRLGEILIQAGYVTERELNAVISMQAGVAPILLDPQTKVKLKEEIPFKIINEFHVVIFDFDLESKTILIALYDTDYLSCLEEYFASAYPGYLSKFYLEDREKILAILANNYPGKPLRIETAEKPTGIKTGAADTPLDRTVMKFIEFLNGFSSEVQLDNLDNAVWLKGENRDFKIDIYLTRKGK
jgi:hypothetical protein